MADNTETTKASGKKDNKKKKKEGNVSETDGQPSTSSGTEGNQQKNKKKEKPKKTDKKSKPKSGNQSETEGIGFQSQSPSQNSYPGMQMDDFHETPSCFSKLSNPLKKKQGYDFETVAESSSVHYQEVPVSIERGPSNAKSVGEVRVNAKDDGSLPPLKQTQPITRSVEPGFTRFQDQQDPNLSKARNDKNAAPPVNNVKKYEEKIEQLEKENKLQQEEIQGYKKQLVTLAKEKDDIIASRAENATPPVSDLESYTERIEQLEQQREAYKDEIQDYKTQVVMLTRERDDITARAADNLPPPISDIENYTERIEQLEKQTMAYQDEIQEYQTQMVMLRKERDDVTARLSEEWDQKVAADESNVENINIPNRPMRMTEEYELLCSPEWNEAKDALDQHCDMSEYGKLTLLCNIMLESAKVCGERYDEILANIILQISQPFVDPNEEHLQHENKDVLHTEPEALRESVALEMIFSGQSFQDGETLQGDEDKSDINEELRGKTTSVDEHGSDDEHVGKESKRGNGDHASTGNNLQGVSGGEYIDQVDSDDEHDHRLNQQVHLNADSEAVKLREKDDSIQAGKRSSSKSGQENNPKQKYAYFESRVRKVEIPKHLEVMLGDMMRKSAHKVEVTEMTHVINEYIEISTSFSLKSGVRLRHLEPLQKYITTCLQFGWKMTLQRPKMVYRTEGIGLPWNEKHQNPCYGSDNPHSPSAVVLLYRSPELLLGDKVLVKGTVLIKEQIDSE